MTEERAKELGIFTAWAFVSCQTCNEYTPIKDLEQHCGAIKCSKCIKLADNLAKKKEQGRLFDDSPSLF